MTSYSRQKLRGLKYALTACKFPPSQTTFYKILYLNSNMLLKSNKENSNSVHSHLFFTLLHCSCEYIAGWNMVQPPLNFIRYHVLVYFNIAMEFHSLKWRDKRTITLFGRKGRREGTPHGLNRYPVASKTLDTRCLTLQKEGKTMYLCKWEEEIQKFDFIKREEEMVLPYYFLASKSF